MDQEVKLSPLEIESLRSSWMPGNESYYSSLNDSDRLREYFGRLKDFKVIEIGPGGYPIALDWNCKSYIGVQPHECFVSNVGDENYVLEDGLSFLRKQADSSSVVVSFGVIDEDVLGYGNFFGLTENQKRYMRELTKEIKRASFPFAIIVATAAEKYFGQPNLADLNVGFGGVYSFDK